MLLHVAHARVKVSVKKEKMSGKLSMKIRSARGGATSVSNTIGKVKLMVPKWQLLLQRGSYVSKSRKSLMTEIEELLADGQWNGQNKRKGFHTTAHVTMGRSVQALGATGFERPHTWRIHVYIKEQNAGVRGCT